MKERLRTIALTTIFVLILVLVLQNIRASSVRFLVWDLTIPTALLVLVSFFIGIFAAWFWHRHPRKIEKTEKTL